MTTKALFVKTDSLNSSMDTIVQACELMDMETEFISELPNTEGIQSITQGRPCAIILPAIEEDMEGIKMAQQIRLAGENNVILLCGDTLPAPAYLSTAYREGVADILHLDAAVEAIHMQIFRAAKNLGIKSSESHLEKLRVEESETLRQRCETLTIENAIWKERMVALASASTRIVLGELDIQAEAPRLLIVASSKSQATAARDLAIRLGFDVEILSNAIAAVARIPELKPNLILADGSLPDMDAPQLAQKARKLMDGEGFVFIAWSSNADAINTLIQPGNGIDDIVVKGQNQEAAMLLAAAFIGALR